VLHENYIQDLSPVAALNQFYLKALAQFVWQSFNCLVASKRSVGKDKISLAGTSVPSCAEWARPFPSPVAAPTRREFLKNDLKPLVAKIVRSI
jgi:hypothetical protein